VQPREEEARETCTEDTRHPASQKQILAAARDVPPPVDATLPARPDACQS